MTPSYKDYLPYPPNISTHGPQVDNLITVVHWIMLVLFVGWGIFYVYCLIRFRQRQGHRAQYQPVKAKVAKYTEIGVIIAEAVLLIGLSMPVWASLKHDFPAKGEAIEVRVVGEQFAWNFHYPGRDGKFGRTDPKFVNNTGNSLGIDPGDPTGKDDIITLNEFHFPVNRFVIANLSSKDVIHSFTINVMRVKQDSIPGMVIPIWFKATQTGTFDISCAQLCGLGHYRMQGFVTIDTPEAFAKWMAEKESLLQGGLNQ